MSYPQVCVDIKVLMDKEPEKAQRWKVAVREMEREGFYDETVKDISDAFFFWERQT